MANPFDDNDSFRYNSYRTSLGLDAVKSYTNFGSIEDEVADLSANHDKEVDKYMQLSLESTSRSRQQLESSEQLATSTARDLLEQREKLERTEKNLDEIHKTTQLTQRSLNTIKSIFGGFFKNRFSKTPKANKESSDSKNGNPLSKEAGKSQSAPMYTAPTVVSSKRTNAFNGPSHEKTKGTRWEKADEEIDSNLHEMSSQLSRLRSLGMALGDEVDGQNRVLERIQNKTDRNDDVVRHQDNQMKNLLN